MMCEKAIAFSKQCFLQLSSFGAFKWSSLPQKSIDVQAKKWISDNAQQIHKEDIMPKNILRLHERGLFEDIFPPASANLINTLKTKQCFYCGFDPTADSLHVGNLLSIMCLLHCQRAGHNAIAVIGTATSRTGDPSGHVKDRAILEQRTLMSNAKLIAKNIQKIVDNHALHLYDNRQKKTLPSFKILFNHKWYNKANAVDFVAEVCRCFRIGPMMEKRYIRDRADSQKGLLLSEFMYQVLQAHDWDYLRKEYKCHFQIGGIDQLGNVSAGHDFIRKKTKQEIYGLFTPLVTTLRGEKLGKSAGNSVWLSASKTSPFEFYQYFYRQPDTLVERFLRYFTFIDLRQIERIMIEHKKHPKNKQAQAVLARNVCKIVHGEEGLVSAELCSRALESGRMEDIELLSRDEIALTFAGTNIVHGSLEPDTTVYDAAVNVARALPSGNRGESLIKSGAVWINGQVANYPQAILLSNVHVLKNDVTLLTVDKNNHYIIQWELPRIEHEEPDEGELPPNTEIPGIDPASLSVPPIEEE